MTIAIIVRHLGPGPHPGGTPQYIHGKKKGDDLPEPTESWTEEQVHGKVQMVAEFGDDYDNLSVDQ